MAFHRLGSEPGQALGGVGSWAPGLLGAELVWNLSRTQGRSRCLTSASALFVCEVAAVAGRAGAEGQVGIFTVSSPSSGRKPRPPPVDAPGATPLKLAQYDIALPTPVLQAKYLSPPESTFHRLGCPQEGRERVG